MPRREPSVPLRVLRDRGDLSIPQALALYLCDDPQGPRMTHAEAAAALGMSARQEIATHLARARQRKE